MNKTQIQTTLAPLIAVIAGFLAGHGIFGFDVVTWTTVIGSVGGTGAVLWGAIAARKTALVDTTGKMVGTTVVTDQATADSLPNNKDVVATTPQIAAAVKAAS